jgi:hypothetical protein
MQIHENKKMMRSYLDMQVDEKRKMGDFEKLLNSDQARIWKIDTNRFTEQEREIYEKVKILILINYFRFELLII